MSLVRLSTRPAVDPDVPSNWEIIRPGQPLSPEGLDLRDTIIQHPVSGPISAQSAPCRLPRHPRYRHGRPMGLITFEPLDQQDSTARCQVRILVDIIRSLRHELESSQPNLSPMPRVNNLRSNDI